MGNMKKEIRNLILKQRNNMSPSEVMEKSKKIKDRLFEMTEFREAQSILFYVSYGNEVHTHEMIKETLIKGKRVVVPKPNKEDRTLLLSVLTHWEDLEVGAYDILEPKNESIIEVPINSIDLMIIPGVVFDLRGNRVGHGMGFYDRLLENTHYACLIGLAFELQIVDVITVEKHDVKIDTIVTEDRVIPCLTSPDL